MCIYLGRLARLDEGARDVVVRAEVLLRDRHTPGIEGLGFGMQGLGCRVQVLLRDRHAPSVVGVGFRDTGTTAYQNCGAVSRRARI